MGGADCHNAYVYLYARGRLTGNTKPQLTQVVWPEYDKWFTYARHSNLFFDKFGESIKSKDEKKADQWQFSMFTWDEANPAYYQSFSYTPNPLPLV